MDDDKEDWRAIYGKDRRDAPPQKTRQRVKRRTTSGMILTSDGWKTVRKRKSWRARTSRTTEQEIAGPLKLDEPIKRNRLDESDMLAPTRTLFRKRL